MHVALIAPLFESVPPRLYGGTERVVFNLSRGLMRSGVDVTVFASADSRVPTRLFSPIDAALRLKDPPVRDPLAYNLKLLAQVAERADEFDVIHNHHDYWMLPLTKMTRVPLVTTLHGRLDLPDIGAAFLSYPEAYFVSISDNQRRPLPQLRWMRTIHHGLDAEELEFREKPASGQYLAFLGRIHPEKRPEWAIEIAKLAGIPLKIAAKIEGPEGQDYYDRFVRPHVDGRFIEYVGEISESEKAAFLGNALGLAFPIDWPEPFGLVVIESLACGTPVLARPLGSMPEILVDGITGYCHPDIKTLAKRVKDLPSISRRGCRQWVERNFSLERMTEDYIHVYRHLAELGSVGARAGKGLRTGHHRRDFLYPVERLAHRDS
jgi:glycosyltransferase involved in cell wall biosynthesis